ncbi:MAG: DUF5615 family PIN-like protein [Pirellulaceae bacterium]
MLKGYADEHVVLALIEALRRRGMDAVRVQDRGREETGDADLLDEAQADERVMLTNDTDFLRLTFERAAKREEFAPHLFLAPTATVYRPACARHCPRGQTARIPVGVLAGVLLVRSPAES